MITQIVCTLLSASAQPLQAGPPRAFAFTHVTVIDMTGGPAQSNMTVVITGNRIAALGKADQIKIPKEAQVIDATGKFLQQDNALAIRDLTRVETQALDSFSPDKCARLSERFVKNSTWHDPTLVAFRISSIGDDPALLSDPRLRYIPAAIREEWDPKKSDLSKALTRDDFVGAKRSFSNMLVEVATMRRSGVEFLVGTDAPGVPYCFGMNR